MTTETYRFQFGDLECVVIRDAIGVRAMGDLVVNAEAEELEAIAQRLGLQSEALDAEYNCLLVRTGEQNVLVDAGFGTRLEVRKGSLLQGLDAVGLEPDDIDRIVITHGDGDHISGILDEEGNRVFPRARYTLWQGAWDFWTSGAEGAGLPQQTVDFIWGTYDRIRDRLDLVASEEEFLPGFRLVPAVGHKLDHVVVSITSQSLQLLHVADGIIHPLFMECPDWYAVFDLVPEQALETKRRLLDRAVADDALVFAPHFPFPGLGRVQQVEARWRWLPV